MSLKKTFFGLAFLISSLCFSQDQIKKIIYNDLMMLNEIYDGSIIDESQLKYVINNRGDTSLVNNVPDNYLDKVNLLRVDESNGFYYVKVKFDIVSSYYYPGLFQDNFFEYILFKEEDRFFKINGFYISEILLINFDYNDIREVLKLEVPNRFKKHLQKGEIDKFDKYLTVTILEQLRTYGWNINSKPYVKDLVSYRGNT